MYHRNTTRKDQWGSTEWSVRFMQPRLIQSVARLRLLEPREGAGTNFWIETKKTELIPIFWKLEFSSWNEDEVQSEIAHLQRTKTTTELYINPRRKNGVAGLTVYTVLGPLTPAQPRHYLRAQACTDPTTEICNLH